jgi:S1-C subfamily serine protease
MMKRRVLFSVLIVALLAVSLGAPLASAQTEPASEPGLVIVRVDADGPAAEAGVQRGDILLAMDGQEINRPLDWFRALRTLEAGNDIELQVLHGDDERTLTATVAERNSRAFLGLQVYLGGAEDTTESEPLLLPLATPVVGAQVIEVVDDSPASAAGLQADDVITAVDSKTLDGEVSLADLIAGYQPGDEVVLTIERPGADEETLELTVTLGEHPDDAARPFLGIRYTDSLQMADLDMERFQGETMPFFERRGDRTMPFMPFGRTMPDMTAAVGAVVRTVTADSPAAEAGLEAGDVITAIDGEVVDGPQALVEAVAAREPGDSVMLTVTRTDQDEPLEIEVVLGENPDNAEKAYLGVTIGAFMMRFQGQMPGDRGGMRFQLPFGLGEMELDPNQLPFDLDQLPFDLDQLPFDLPFELPSQQQSDRPQA